MFLINSYNLKRTCFSPFVPILMVANVYLHTSLFEIHLAHVKASAAMNPGPDNHHECHQQIQISLIVKIILQTVFQNLYSRSYVEIKIFSVSVTPAANSSILSSRTVNMHLPSLDCTHKTSF